MKAKSVGMRIGPFILALALGLLNWNASPVSSQPEMEGMPVHAPRNESWQAVLRLPSGWPGRVAWDRQGDSGPVVAAPTVGPVPGSCDYYRNLGTEFPDLIRLGCAQPLPVKSDCNCGY